MDPLVSIIIPVYNGYPYLTEAIESAMDQTYKNIEIIVINDGSNDNGKTAEIVEKFQGRIRYYSKENGGVSSALNYGISKMKGDYFSWLSHDDLYHKDKIQQQINELRKVSFNENFIVETYMNLIDESGKVFRKKKEKTKALSYDDWNKRIYKKTPNGCGLLIPIKMLRNVNGFDERFRYIQDFICWIEISRLPCKVIQIRKNLTSTRIHEKQSTLILNSLLDKERELFLTESISKKIDSKELERLLLYSIKIGKLKEIKRLSTENNVVIPLKIKALIPYLNIKYTLIRIMKKTYWKIVRRSRT